MTAPVTISVHLAVKCVFPLQSGNFLLEKLPTVSLAQAAKYLIEDQTLIALFKISLKLAVPTSPFQISPTNI